MPIRRRALSLSLLGLAACAEVAEPAPSLAPDASLADITAASPDAGVDTAAPPDDGGATAGLVINELRAAGEDWIELMNTGASPIDLAGLRVADLDEATGGPKLAEAIALPVGLTLAPGARLVIVADVASPREGLQADCLGGAVASCVEAGYGLSGSRGDRVFVLAATGDAVLSQAAYPAPSEVTVPDGQSWGRLPDGTGAFAPAAPTPGALNAAP
jgi:hypothetical protein